MHLSRFLMVAICLTTAGCSSLGRPDWLEPGPAMSQRRRAVRFDPYLQDDIAPAALRMPLMDGARPRDFADPVPEVALVGQWSLIQITGYLFLRFMR